MPMPSTRDYVVRPKWKVEHEFKKVSKGSVGGWLGGRETAYREGVDVGRGEGVDVGRGEGVNVGRGVGGGRGVWVWVEGGRLCM